MKRIATVVAIAAIGSWLVSFEASAVAESSRSVINVSFEKAANRYDSKYAGQ